MKKITILGSTGSIGVNTLNVARLFPKNFQIIALTANKNISLLEKQIKEFKPQAVALMDEKSALVLKSRHKNLKVFKGVEGLRTVATLSGVDMVVSATVGSVGLLPTIAAIKAKKDVALANKEVLVMAGEIVVNELKKHQTRLLPVDSEHSALFQCLLGRNIKEVESLILTASGGPFLKTPLLKLKKVLPQQALKHPRWKMGKKISIDSATLINKGLEIIEARWLFNMPPEKIKVVIHPESIIHSMVEFVDSSIVAQIGLPDMRVPIQYALTYPQRFENRLKRLSFSELKQLTFDKPDLKKFPALNLAYESLKIGGTMPAVLNAANEVAVERFLHNQIGFLEISKTVEKIMRKHNVIRKPALEDILEADREVRESF